MGVTDKESSANLAQLRNGWITIDGTREVLTRKKLGHMKLNETQPEICCWRVWPHWLLRSNTWIRLLPRSLTNLNKEMKMIDMNHTQSTYTRTHFPSLRQEWSEGFDNDHDWKGRYSRRKDRDKSRQQQEKNWLTTAHSAPMKSSLQVPTDCSIWWFLLVHTVQM